MFQNINIGLTEYAFLAVVLFIILIYLIIKVRNLYLISSVTSLWRGNRSERNLILRLRKMGFAKDEVYHDLYVPKNDGKYSQIDAVAITDFGIIVFEVKDYAGWVFGNGYNQMWSQSFPNGHKKQFYNPVLQNRGHIASLKRILNKYGDDIPFFSVIVFYGKSELKDITFLPENVFVAKDFKLKNALKRIRKNYNVYEYSDVDAVMDVLYNCSHRGDHFGIEDEHIDNINESMGRDRIFD